MTGKVSEQDRAVVKKAAALMVRSPELKPTAALRELGIRSEQRIKRLRTALRTPTTHSSPQVSKPAKNPKTSARTTKPAKTAALKVQGAAVRDALVAAAKRDVDNSTTPFAPVALVVDAQFALWKNLMSWTPLGIVMNMAVANNAAAWNSMVSGRRS